VIPSELHVVVPGPLDQLTGGYVYDAHMVAGLRELGWSVHVHNLAGSFPEPDQTALDSMRATLGSIEDDALVLIDGLAMGGLPELIEAHAGRLRILALVHHPLAEETGLSGAERRSFAERERRALDSCRGVLVSSPFSARGLQAYGVPAHRVRSVLPGTEWASYAAGPGPDADPVLLCVASVTPRKGHDVLVQALERVRDLPWKCVCVGSLDRDRAHADAVQRRISAAALEERIDFVGERGPNLIREVYHTASIFVLASFYEGYGMALAEHVGAPVGQNPAGRRHERELRHLKDANALHHLRHPWFLPGRRARYDTLSVLAAYPTRGKEASVYVTAAARSLQKAARAQP
jgi:glycosyltransferase involved in cell wall biosynthesis